ncbi:MAG: putative toxin-antitoxin system toxin component, PIN family [Elusimicrobia bacterium]|nr:putative toxin-antitoxin system toxin component, PIN family [Elusimicrobiota bacterium]
MNVVLDTNVVVSGFLNPFSPPGSLVRLVAEGLLTLCYDARILSEYREVLLRPKFGFQGPAIDDFLTHVQAEGDYVVARPLAQRLPDPSDEPFLEVALAGKARYLVTGNTKHFPHTLCQGMRVILPTEFQNVLRTEWGGEGVTP